MKRSTNLLLLCLAVFAALAGAYEYELQFTPSNPGYKGLVVAGYSFESNGTVVVGNCSYFTTSPIKKYPQTCRWNLQGHLLSMTAGAPAVPAPLFINGTQLTFAKNAAGDSTGADLEAPEHGFVSTPGIHYSWLPPKNPLLLHQLISTLTATLKNDGDEDLDISAVTPSARLSAVTVKSETCTKARIPVGETCSITLTYDDTKVKSPIGLALDTLYIDVASDAGAGPDFVELFALIVAK